MRGSPAGCKSFGNKRLRRFFYHMGHRNPKPLLTPSNGLVKLYIGYAHSSFDYRAVIHNAHCLRVKRFRFVLFVHLAISNSDSIVALTISYIDVLV